MLRIPKLLALSCILLAARAGERPRCSPIRGAERLWARPGLRFVLVGEMHGTAETPAIFADLVCSARQTNRPIVVGVELREQRALDAFMASGSPEAGVGELLATEEWRRHDGRTSAPMLALVARLRALKMEGVVSRVVAFSVTRAGESAAQGEERMASALLEAAAREPDALVIALSGNVHACKEMLAEVGPYRLMGSFLPPARTVSLIVRDRGGRAWNCQSGACGPHALDSSGGVKRGITFASPHPGYDGALATGLKATASAPSP